MAPAPTEDRETRTPSDGAQQDGESGPAPGFEIADPVGEEGQDHLPKQDGDGR